MKSKIIAVIGLCIMFLLLVGIQASKAAYFDFDSLPYPGGSSDIDSYMENIYGSDITVTNAIVGDGVLPGPLGPDHYIQSNISLGLDWFEVSFDSIQIKEISFEWGTTANEFNMTAFDSDRIEIFSFHEDCSLYNSGLFSTVFTAPIQILRFNDHGIGEVGIDNLDVTPIPIPSAIWILGSGLLGLAGFRWKFKNWREELFGEPE